MANYVITRDDELMHYGVKGMRWGVTRASSKLSKATTKEERDNAISTLNKHKTKAYAKVQKLNKQYVKLQKDVDRHVIKNNTRAAKLKEKSAKLKRKATRRFVSERKAEKLMMKAMKMDVRSDIIIAKSNLAKSKLEKNKTMTRLFNTGISDIDKILSE